jgi:hypothetical protein
MATHGGDGHKMKLEAAHSTGRLAGFATALVLALALGAPAWASGSTIEGTATLAPIGTGSYLLSVTNTGTDEIKAVIFGGENLSNFASSPALSCSESLGHATCGGTIEPSASAQVCYSGPAVEQVQLNFTVDVQVSSAPAGAGFHACHRWWRRKRRGWGLRNRRWR